MSARREPACGGAAVDRRAAPDLGLALADFLGAVDARMGREIAANSAAAPAAAFVATGGKRLRARLLWLSAAAAARTPIAAHYDQLLSVATAIELAHLASLIHDDIVDGAKTRRGIPALHWQCGVSSAVGAGTALLHLAGALIAPLPASARRAVAHAALAMCRGQVRELMQSFQLCSRRQRLAIMRQKTAALFEVVAHLGVNLVGGSPSCDEALRRFARRFGIAFQIADDIMDLVGDPTRLGRANGADLCDGVMTLPVLLAAETSPAIRQVLARLSTNGDPSDVAECIRLIAGTGAIAAAAAESRRWLGSASAALRLVPPSQARRELLSLGEAVVTTPTGPVGQPNTLLLDVGARQHRTGPLRFDRRCVAAGRASRSRHRRPFAALDALILRRLARLEPTLPAAVRPLMLDGRAAAIAAGLWRSCAQRGEDVTAIALGARAFALAQCATINERLACSTIQALAASDCLQAVALAFFADASASSHADVEIQILRSLQEATFAAGSHPHAWTSRYPPAASRLALSPTVDAASVQ